MGIDFTGGNTVMMIVLFVAGLICIVKGSDLFVAAATWIAEASGIPKFIVGATAVSFAAAMPEIALSVFTAFDGGSHLAAGNALGSVMANTGIIMCLLLICLPCLIDRKQFGFSAVCLLAAAAALYLLTRGNGVLTRKESLVLLVIFAVYFAETIYVAKRDRGTEAAVEAAVPKDGKTATINVVKFIGGAVIMVLGAQLLVGNGKALADLIGVYDEIMGATLIAVGALLPKLVTTITAIRKKQPSLSVGNIIGANIIDLTLVIPLCSLISGKPLFIEAHGKLPDIPACLIISFAALAPALIMGKFKKWQGFVIGGLYIAYLAVMSVYFVA